VGWNACTWMTRGGGWRGLDWVCKAKPRPTPPSTCRFWDEMRKIEEGEPGSRLNRYRIIPKSSSCGAGNRNE